MSKNREQRVAAAIAAVESSPKQKVAVVCGGQSVEHEVSLASGAAVVAALAVLGHEVHKIVIERNGHWRADSADGFAACVELIRSSDVIFPTIHGVGGEDGTLQGLLEFFGVPYVGCGVTASAVGISKDLSKILVEEIGLKTAGGIVIDTEVGFDLAAIPLEGNVFVKANRGGSSYGVTRVCNRSELAAAIAVAAEVDNQVLIEPEVIGREVDLGVLQLPDGSLLVSNPLEILADPNEPFFTAEAKYNSSATVFQIPADLPAHTVAELQQAALAAFNLLGCTGLARVDFFVTEQGIVFNELNTLPGLGPVSQFPRMCANLGIDYPRMAGILLQTATHRLKTD